MLAKLEINQANEVLAYLITARHSFQPFQLALKPEPASRGYWGCAESCSIRFFLSEASLLLEGSNLPSMD